MDAHRFSSSIGSLAVIESVLGFSGKTGVRSPKNDLNLIRG